eukprot:NODE_26102_length_219_cov_1.200000_g24932_i0.p3 GENE.NODE_26102_length_219_cov_1.200000_g24932_i0~~NODE_26102_length_219_cov_1.200000_g24932_i0.p3  ORF type:complete len:50 (-),score=6.73 NODE_26102_length_219_cov_1.200000_g24932_i0:68-196(-)
MDNFQDSALVVLAALDFFLGRNDPHPLSFRDPGRGSPASIWQ